MCRLLGYVDPASGSSADWFLNTDRSLLAQSDHAPDQLQDDGWGVAWYPSIDSDAEVRKGVRGAFRPEEKPAFLDAVRSARGPLVIGHLRHASNPLHLAREQLLALENSQPYSLEQTVFAHNGTIYLPTKTRGRLGPWATRVRGVNDSEVLFWLLARWDRELEDPLAAYSRTVSELWDVWEQHGRPASGPFGGLNVLWARSPTELWAFCHWRGEHGGGLFDTRRPYYEMRYRRTQNGVIVGSEPFDNAPDRWQPIPNGAYLRVETSDVHVTVRTGSIPLEMERLRT